jgi:hypothetical protein
MFCLCFCFSIVFCGACWSIIRLLEFLVMLCLVVVCVLMCDVRLICNHLYSPLLGTDQHIVTNRDVTWNNYNTLTVVFTGRCLVAALRFLFFHAASKVQCKVPTPDWRQTDDDADSLTTADDCRMILTDTCRLSHSFSLYSLWTDRKENPASNNSSIVEHVSVARKRVYRAVT